MPSPVGVLSTPVIRTLAARFSFFKRGLGVVPASRPRSSRRLLGAPFAEPPEEPAPPKPPRPIGDEGGAALAAAATAAEAALRETGSPTFLRALVPVAASILACIKAILSEVKELWSQSQSGCVHPTWSWIGKGGRDIHFNSGGAREESNAMRNCGDDASVY